MPLNNPPPIQHPVVGQNGVMTTIWTQWAIKVAKVIDGGTP